MLLYEHNVLSLQPLIACDELYQQMLTMDRKQILVRQKTRVR